MIVVIALAAMSAQTHSSARLEPIPDKLVVLTFDDSKASHYTVVRPLLKKYGFGATFFSTKAFSFRTNKEDYLWPGSDFGSAVAAARRNIRTKKETAWRTNRVAIL